jgi:hypothetical protein
MKSLKRLSGELLALALIFSGLGATSASATELYSGGTTLGVGSEIVMTLKSGISTALKTTAGETLTTCAGSEMEAKISNAGGATQTVKATATKFSIFAGCVIKIVEKGEIDFHALAGKNAQITTKGFKVIWATFGGEIECTYGGGAGTSMGTLSGSTTESATVNVEAVLSKVEGSLLCPSDAKWTAIYIVTRPKPLHATTS